ncbi:hypothetical protein KAS08_00360 [Candidatus Pacearchaeota archaeon]|nr:hypothetical protein [Candidatus Pacearchaeota archaeon]
MVNILPIAIITVVVMVMVNDIINNGWKSAVRLAITIISLTFSLAFILFTMDCWKINELGLLSKKDLTSISQLQIILNFVGEYLFISTTTICFHSWRKGGMNNLKGYCNNEVGIIGYLGLGLVSGIFFGITATLTFGLAGIFIVKSFHYLLASSIIGFCGGLSLGLLFGIIAGSICERKKEIT